MALALADSIGAAGWDLNDQARRYGAWWRRGHYSVIDRCFDIGGTTGSALRKFEQTGDAWTSGGTGERTQANGSLMRLAPVPIAFHALYPGDVTTLAERAAESSLPTHGHPVCLSACRYLAVVLAALAHGEPREVVLARDWPSRATLGPLEAPIAAVAAGSFREKQPPEIIGDGGAVVCLEAALWAFHDAADFREAVLRAVNLGRDADTTGAVCGQLAGACWGESGIPPEWLAGLARREMVEAGLAALGVG